MSEQVDDKKVDEKKTCLCGKINFKVIIGVALITVGLAAAIKWRFDLLTVIKGCVGLFLVMAGAIAIAIAKE